LAGQQTHLPSHVVVVLFRTVRERETEREGSGERERESGGLEGDRGITNWLTRELFLLLLLWVGACL